MKKEVTIKEDMAAFYKNAGKELWIYNGLFRNKVLSIKKIKPLSCVKPMLNMLY